MKTDEDRKIVFYDGDCPLCSRTVRFLLRRDRKRRMKFAALQGATARALLPSNLTINPNSLVFLNSGKLHMKASAAIRTLGALGGLWKTTQILRVVPRFISNAVYDVIAKNRKRIYPKACSISPEYADQMLP